MNKKIKKILRITAFVVFLQGSFLWGSSSEDYLYCGGAYGSFYRLDKLTLDISWYSRYGDTLAQLSTLGNTGLDITEPVDMIFNLPDQLLILDRQKRQISEFSRHLNYIGTLTLPNQLISPMQLAKNSDQQLIIYDDFHQQLYSLNGGKAEDFSDENILYSSMDKKIDLTFFDNELWLFLPGESSIYIFNQNGQLSETYEIPPTLSNTQCLFHPFQAYKVILYCQDNLVLYNLKTKKQKKITAMGLNWSFIYHRELYLSEGIDNFKIRNITLRF